MATPVKYHVGGFPPAKLDWSKILPLIGPSSAAVARYDGLLNAIPNVAVLLSPLMTREAVLSSKIEGTQATMGQVLEFEAKSEFGGTEESRGEIREILNYRRAMAHSGELLKKLPICQRIVKESHGVLMEGVRGHDKTPGQYRKGPNWIGPAGCSIEEAVFIPISADAIRSGMDKWERYIHSGFPDKLVQTAILHAEFEALHPFSDGNGRIGRMMIPLCMTMYGLLKAPMFYISAYFESHRDQYYERLLAVSRDGNWTDWVIFFLESVNEQAKENQDKAQSIRELYDETHRSIADITHSRCAVHATEFLFRRPIFSASDFHAEPHLTKSNGRRILSVLQGNDFFRLVRPASGRRPAILAYKKLLNVAEGREVF